jgi:hypothetical protein
MKLISLAIGFLVCFSLASQAQNDTNSDPYEASDTLHNEFGLFANDEIMKISILFDITEYKREKSTEEYLPATLVYHINATDSVCKQIRLKSRGEFRNANCDFPPIRLNFKKAGFEADDVKKIEKLKLVTHCQTGNEEGVLKEYLIYKLYNALTEFSFRVRLIEISYVNTHKKQKPVKSFAFMIEPIEFLAQRNNAIPIESVNLTQNEVVPVMMDRASIFNYMIGNTDMAVPNQHNCKLLVPNQISADRSVFIVPYDFDYSGLVDASYAIPHESLGISSVRERKYFGICRSKQEFYNALDEFIEKKEEFYRIISSFEYADNRTKDSMIRYLDEFYDDLENKDKLVKVFMAQCKNID